MSCSGRKNGCGSGDPVYVDPGSRRFLFPTDIRKLLILVAEDDDEDNVVDIVLDACANHCFIEDARVIAVTDNTVILREGRGCDGRFRFVCIDCICEVIVDCDVILDELFEEHSFNRE